MAGNNKMTKKIRKGDNVVILTGRDKGKTGDVLRVMRQDQRVIVQGVNMVKRHTAPSQNNPGGIDEKETSVHISKVGFKVLEDGRKVRVALRSGELID